MFWSHTATIQKLSKVSDGGGGSVESWTDFKTIDCEVSAVNGNEYYRAQQLQNPIEYEIFTDYDSTIKPSMRVVFNGLTLSIKSVLPIFPDINGDYEQLNLKCVTV